MPPTAVATNAEPAKNRSWSDRLFFGLLVLVELSWIALLSYLILYLS